MPNFRPGLPQTVIQISQLVWRQRGKAYLVGGPVRDLLLNHPCPDWDIAVDFGLRENRAVVERKMSELLGAVARLLKGKFVFHRPFLTGTVTLPDSTKIDICHTRRESYRKPATLPRVEPASIEDDLARRDFTINALALELTPDGEKLIDPFSGQEDLHHRLIRIIHPLSFIDDPTRIFRALRFAIRLDYNIESGTLYLLRVAVKERYPALLTPERILYELRCILAESAALKMLQALLKENVLPSCWNNWRLDRSPLPGLKKLSQRGATSQELFCYLLSFLPVNEKFPITSEERDTARFLRHLNPLRHRLLRAKKVSTIYHILKPIPEPVLLIMTKLEPPTIQKKCNLFLHQLRFVKPETTAADLIALGIPPGPKIGQLMKRLLTARLDKKVQTRQEELRLLKRWTNKGC